VDPRGLPDDAALPQTTVKVAPTKGAVVRAKFHPSVGKRVLLTLLRPADSPVPFGAVASVAGNTSGAGIVNEGNQVYLTGVKDESSVTVRWGQGQQKQCVAELSVPEKPGPAGVYVTSAQCL
ncbi:FimD/PapC C-terminal domain-containing protein, partial [Salmonella enterica subsp. enterica serovar Newport]|nr:capsule biosynthesis protein [Salmonella enterica]ECD6344144.1 capsule biosynthesis protein [Salmonella enterica subsp. enterica serovar Newport]ECM3181225.1 capsule biosynthesis protein [Salmonella enterica subsp. enterica serovar Newport]HAG2284948.1 capsule biosynthesis protein [Salmonella enterica]